MHWSDVMYVCVALSVLVVSVAVLVFAPSTAEDWEEVITSLAEPEPEPIPRNWGEPDDLDILIEKAWVEKYGPRPDLSRWTIANTERSLEEEYGDG